MSKYSELAQRREDARRRAERRQLWQALRKGEYDKSTLTHTLTFDGRPVTVTEAEYLWLRLRGHLIGATVTDTHFIQLHPTTTFNQKEYHHGT